MIEQYLTIFINTYKTYSESLWNSIINPSWTNYFYWFLFISLFFYALEILFPWRKNQPKIRKDFWLDCFYMFFNLFIFPLLIFESISRVVVTLLNTFLAEFNIANLVAFEVQSWVIIYHFLLIFIVRDFIQWWIHRLLHRSDRLWKFHQVHHSVEQMGFAAHLRFHWMENIVYSSIQYLPLALIGIGSKDFFIVYIFTLAIGHFNHSNFKLPMGPLKYIFNNPQMHIWHHAYNLPNDRKYGVNFGLTLSIWDYIFGTNFIPSDGRDIKLGIPGMNNFPSTFLKQITYGFGKS